MSAISLKSITGITSITTPAGVDNQLTLHTNDTTQRVKVTQSGIEVVGVATFQDLDVDGHINLDNVSVAGISTFGGSTQNTVQVSHNSGYGLRVERGGRYLDLNGNWGSSGYGAVSASHGLRFISGASSNIQFFNNTVEAVRIHSSGKITIGHDEISNDLHGPQTTNGRNPLVQIHGANAASAAAALISWKNQAGAYYAPTLYLAHSGSDTIGTNGILPANGEFGSIVFSGDDGTDFVKGAMIKARLDGTPGNDDMPGRLEFHTTPDGAQAPVERLRIDSNGAVMIRTTTAGAHSSDLTIGGTTGAGRIMIRSANNGGGYINFQDTTGSTVDGSIEYNHILNSFNFYFESQERFRIHTQGMLGLSGANYGTSGQVLTSGGTGSPVSWTTVSGTTINNNADNRIITGSGTANTLEGEAGLTYNGSMLNVNSVTSENNAFRIYNTTDNSVRYQINGEGNSFIGHTYPRADASIDLGFHTGYRWRDVVLSGGIRFGSSSADDYLDDYEEGTFTPTINVGSYTTFLTNRYIKIGRLVHLHGGLIFNNNSSGTRVEISNIPFAQQSGGQYVGNVWLRRTSTGERNWNMILGEAGTNVLGIFRDSNGGHSDMGGHLSYSDFGSSATYFNYSITYISAS